MLPLQDTILYSADSYPNRYWTAERNTTEWNVFMTEITNTGNALSTALLTALAPTLEGAHLGTHPLIWQVGHEMNAVLQVFSIRTGSSRTSEATLRTTSMVPHR